MSSTYRAKLNQNALAIAELQKRKKTIEAIRASCFKEQLDFIDDTSRLKTGKCTRRAGKSYGAGGAYFCIEGIKNPGCTMMYITGTREQAKRIMFKDVLKALNRRFDLGLKFNHTSLEVLFPNGSILYLIGTDSSPEEAEKALGQKYKLVIIDEAGSWKNDQEHLVHSVLEPACADLEGTICMIGSPQNHTRSYFFRVTYYGYGDPKYVHGWSRHEWTWNENPHTRRQMSELIERLLAGNPRVKETPIFRQMYLNQWVVDDSAKVYKFEDKRNVCAALPPDHTWRYVLGLDLGYEDPTAIVIIATSETCNTAYIVDVFKREKLDLTAVASALEVFRHKYNPVFWVVDNAAKQAVEELKNRFHFPLIPADKQGKFDIIQIMNNDFITGRIQVLESEAAPLIEEYSNLIWDEKSVVKVEHPGCENHAADAALYAWRKCFHYAYAPQAPKPRKGSEEEMEAWWDKQAAIGAKRQKDMGYDDFVSIDFKEEYH